MMELRGLVLGEMRNVGVATTLHCCWSVG